MSLINLLMGLHWRANVIPAVAVSKNIRTVPFSATASNEYHAFGSGFQINSSTAAYIFRRGISETVGGSPTYAHLYRGRTAIGYYSPGPDSWTALTEIDSEAGRDLSDVHCAGMLDSGEAIYFSSISPVAIAYLDAGEPYPAGNFVPFFRKGTVSGNSITWGSRQTLTGYDTDIRSGTVFGELQKGDNPGEFYVCMCQFGYGASETARKLWCIKTTDYFETWSYNLIYSGTFAFSETSVAYLGGGRMFAFARLDNGGYLYLFKSSDSGATWTPLGYDVLNNTGWYWNQVKIPSAIFVKDGLLTLMYHDRDSKFVTISKNNDPDVFFTQSPPELNDVEYYYYIDHGTFNPSLGYPSLISFNSNFLFIACVENSTTDANLVYTMDDLTTDPAGVPVAPPTITESFVSGSTFRLEISGYTDAQLQNIRYWLIDVSTNSGFSSFITASYNGTSAGLDHVGATMQNKRMPLWILLNGLTGGTTYYVRIKAVNNAGSSSYTNKTITTS